MIRGRTDAPDRAIRKSVSSDTRTQYGPRERGPFRFNRWLGMLRNRDVRFGRYVDTSMSLEQTLMSRSQEREIGVVVLVVDFDAFGKTGGRVTRNDQAYQHTVHIHLIAVRRSPTA